MKVVCIDAFDPPEIGLIKGEVYNAENGCNETNYFIIELQLNYLKKRFAPIQTNYADATAEILENFKQTEETPDKILIPIKLIS